MRLRNVKGARQMIEAHPQYIIDDQENTMLQLDKLFASTKPIHIEIGMGKGQFIYDLAASQKDVNFIGIERFDSVIIRALEKVIEAPLENLYLLRADAMHVLQLIPPQSVERIYLNFSDPWPKDRHHKRRLTSLQFLDRYKVLLQPLGEIHFKTDNPVLFSYSVQTITEHNMDILFKDNDIHSHENCDNIMTEFEAKFVAEGKPIHKIIARFKEEQHG